MFCSTVLVFMIRSVTVGDGKAVHSRMARYGGLSIIMPAYAGCSYMRRALRSIK